MKWIGTSQRNGKPLIEANCIGWLQRERTPHQRANGAAAHPKQADRSPKQDNGIPKTCEEYVERFGKQLRGMKGLFDRDDARLDVLVKNWIESTTNCSGRIAQEIFTNCAGADVFQLYTHDDFESEADKGNWDLNITGWCGADACAEDERGILRVLGSKWLEAGAYARAEAARKENERLQREEARRRDEEEAAQAERLRQIEEERPRQIEARREALKADAAKLANCPEIADASEIAKYADMLGLSGEISNDDLFMWARRTGNMMRSGNGYIGKSIFAAMSPEEQAAHEPAKLPF
jgi:hypothetical protein